MTIFQCWQQMEHGLRMFGSYYMSSTPVLHLGRKCRSNQYEKVINHSWPNFPNIIVAVISRCWTYTDSTKKWFTYHVLSSPMAAQSIKSAWALQRADRIYINFPHSTHPAQIEHYGYLPVNGLVLNTYCFRSGWDHTYGLLMRERNGPPPRMEL